MPEIVRDTKPMQEIQKGIYCGQEFIEDGSSELRLDHAMRLWGLGVDRELFNEEHKGVSRQEYYEVIHEAPEAWKSYDLPSFGRSEDLESKLDVAFNKLSEDEKSEWRLELHKYLIRKRMLESLD
jgi:hypothetical protein